MIKYSTLEDTSNKVLFKAFMQSFEGFRITTETTYESFSEMLVERNYDPTISIGAFDTETGKLVSYVLNSINETDKKTSYDILTGTIPDYRRRGISKTIFEKMKTLLQQKGVQLYKTEVLKTNAGALALYLSVGFAVKNEVVSVIKTPKGSREVYEYEIVMNIYGGKGMKLTLVRPTLEMKELALDYRKEHFDNNEMIINGSELLDKTDSYEEWLKSVTDNTSPDTVSPNWVVTDTFFAVDENGKIIGIIDFRHTLNEFLKDFGNSGYSVRPSERRKGYATEMLRQIMEIAKQAGLKELHLSVERNNKPSVKTIIKNGGKYERSFEFGGEEADVYKIVL